VFFWIVTQCSHVDGYQRFGGTYRLHLQGRAQDVSLKRRYSPTGYMVLQPRRAQSTTECGVDIEFQIANEDFAHYMNVVSAINADC
jgi:hypothetical protein